MKPEAVMKNSSIERKLSQKLHLTVSLYPGSFFWACVSSSVYTVCSLSLIQSSLLDVVNTWCDDVSLYISSFCLLLVIYSFNFALYVVNRLTHAKLKVWLPQITLWTMARWTSHHYSKELDNLLAETVLAHRLSDLSLPSIDSTAFEPEAAHPGGAKPLVAGKKKIRSKKRELESHYPLQRHDL